MSAKKLNSKSVSSSEYKSYLHSAEKLFEGATSAVASSNWTAAAVLIVHAAIAYTDALTIKYGGVKNSGEHGQAADLIRQHLALSEADTKSLKRFEKLIRQKSEVSYTGASLTKEQTESMLRELTRYRDWAVAKLT